MKRAVPGPLIHPTAPRLRAPSGSCDCHCHVFGPIARFPFDSARDYTPPEAPLEDYITLLSHLGIERTVLVQPSVHGADNSAHEDAVIRMGGRARGVAVLAPTVEDAEIDRLHQIGFRGVRFNLLNKGGSTALEHLETLAAKVAPFGWHVQTYMRGTELATIKNRLSALPAPVVLDHLGHPEPALGLQQPAVRALLELLDTGRCWVKLIPYRFDQTGFPYPEAQSVARLLAQSSPERLLWGTDWPHPDIPDIAPGKPAAMPDDGLLLDALGVWFEDEALVKQVLVENPASLYGF